MFNKKKIIPNSVIKSNTHIRTFSTVFDYAFYRVIQKGLLFLFCSEIGNKCASTTITDHSIVFPRSTP